MMTSEDTKQRNHGQRERNSRNNPSHHQQQHYSRRNGNSSSSTGSGNHRHHSSNNNKRHHSSTTPWNNEKYEEDEVDDLVVAAQYAFAVPAPTFSTLETVTDVELSQEQLQQTKHIPGTINDIDEDEIDLDDDKFIVLPDGSSKINEEVTKTESNGYSTECRNEGVAPNDANTSKDPTDHETKNNDDDDDDSNNNDNDDDSESDVDLVEQLAHMVGDEDGVDDDDDDEDDDNTIFNSRSKVTKTIRSKPMTVNEIDAYEADLHQIHDLLQYTVSINEEGVAIPPQLSSEITPTEQSSRSKVPQQQESIREYQIAGHIQHHMVDDRTAVILSVIGGVLLKEGTTLIIQRKDIETGHYGENNNSVNGDRDSNDDSIPFGIILEIFGPVTQPLYSVRFPLPSIEEKNLVRDDPTSPKIIVTETVNEVMSYNDKEITNGPDISETYVKEITTSLPVEPAENVHNRASSPEIIDPWSRSGEYTKILRACPALPVYYCCDPTSATVILDTEAVIRSSGRGCDASNLFDEEIVDVQDYSDDEQERAAKGNKNKKTHGTVTATSGTAHNPHRNHYDQNSASHRNHNNQPHHRMVSGVDRNRPQFSSTPSGYNPPRHHPHQYPNVPPVAFYSDGVGAPFYPSYPPNYYATQMSTGVPQLPSQFVLPQHASYLPAPVQFGQPWYYFTGTNQTVPPPPPPPPPPTTNTAQHPPPAQGGSGDTVYYEFS